MKKSLNNQEQISLNCFKMLNKSRNPETIRDKNKNLEPYHSLKNWIELNKKQSLEKKYIHHKKSFSIGNKVYKAAKNIEINFLNPKKGCAQANRIKSRCNSADTSSSFSSRNTRSVSNSPEKYEQNGIKLLKTSVALFLTSRLKIKTANQIKGLKINLNESPNRKLHLDCQQFCIKGSKII